MTPRPSLRLPHALVALLLCLLATGAAPATAAPAPEAEAVRVVTAELWGQRHLTKDRVARAAAAETAKLAPCRKRGKGWKRIRGVANRSQRAAYTRAARTLWRDLRSVARQRAFERIMRPWFGRYIARLDALGLRDPALVAGIAAQKRRLAAQARILGVASCRTFERRLRRVRGFRSGGQSQGEVDARIGSLVNGIGLYVESKRRAAENSYADALTAASERLLALGAEQGDADAFEFAFYLGE